MRKIFKIALAMILTLTMLAGSLIFVSAAEYSDGTIIMNEAMIAQLAGDDGNTDGIFGTNTSMTWDGDELVYAPTGNSQIALSSFPTADELPNGYTVSVDFCITNTGSVSATTTKIVNMGINNIVAWGQGSFLQFQPKGTYDGTTITDENNKKVYVQNRTSSTDKSGETNVTFTKSAFGTYFNYTIKVGAENAEFYFDGSLLSAIPVSELRASTWSAPYLGARGGITVRFDNFKVWAGTGEPITLDPVYDVESGDQYGAGLPVVNEAIIDELAGDDGDTSGIFQSNTVLTWDGEKLVYKPTSTNVGDGRVALGLFPTALDEYTVSADFILAAGSASNTKNLMQLVIGNRVAWADGSYLELATVYDTATETDGIGASSTWGFCNYNKSIDTTNPNGKTNQTYDNGSYTLGTAINVKFVVGKDTTTIYVGGAQAWSLSTSALRNGTEGIFIGGRTGTTIYIDNFNFYEGTGEASTSTTERIGADGNVKYFGHQRTTEAKTGYGLRFISEVNVTSAYKALGFKVDVTSSADNNATVIKSFDEQGSTVFKKVSGLVNGQSAYYEPHSGYTALQAIVITDIPMTAGVTYTFTVTPYAVMKDGDTVYYTPYIVQYDGTAAPVDRA
ncbi:MAG: hypothetical protein IJ038_07270 [Clostridia bacterium]|nr:hypothetical protein [Clostridia bacterium]